MIGSVMRRLRFTLIVLATLICACATNVAAPSCNPVAGMEPLLQEGGVIMVGDYHGTNEPPEVFFELACAYVSLHQVDPVVIAVELPDSLNAAFEEQKSFEEAIAALRKDVFWDEFGDGRHSAAMLSMTERLLQLAHHSNGRVRLLAIERPMIDSAGAMFVSDSLRKSGAERSLVFLGNAHARRSQMRGQRSPPMGQVLQDLGHRVVSLNIRPGGGEAWICSGPDNCSRRALPASGSGEIQRIEFNRCEGDHCAFDGFYYIPKLTVSDPARI